MLQKSLLHLGHASSKCPKFVFCPQQKKFLLTMNHLSQEQQSKCLPLLVSQGTTRAATRILPDCYWTATRHQPNQTTDED